MQFQSAEAWGSGHKESNSKEVQRAKGTDVPWPGLSLLQATGQVRVATRLCHGPRGPLGVLREGHCLAASEDLCPIPLPRHS